MLRSLLENGNSVDVIVSNLSERGISSSDITKRLERRYPGASFIVRKHPSLLDKSTKEEEKKLYKLYKLTLLLDKLKFNQYKALNSSLMPFNIQKTVKKQLKKQKYDIVYSNYLYNVPSFFKRRNFKLVCDIHDLQYRRIENDVIPEQNFIKAFLYKTLFKVSELSQLKIIDTIISISPVESNLVKKLIPNSNVVTIPATADEQCITKKINDDYKFDFTFIGSNSDANRDSLVWFLDNCFEEIVKQKQNIKFLIQGKVNRNPLIKNSLIVKKYLNRNIKISEFVEDLSDVYSDTKVIICPIVKGSGMKIKVIEGISYRKALVGTDIAFEGINIVNNENACIANTESEFIEAILNTIKNEKLRKKFENASYDLFKNEHSFESCKQKLKEVI